MEKRIIVRIYSTSKNHYHGYICHQIGNIENARHICDYKNTSFENVLKALQEIDKKYNLNCDFSECTERK